MCLQAPLATLARRSQQNGERQTFLVPAFLRQRDFWSGPHATSCAGCCLISFNNFRIHGRYSGLAGEKVLVDSSNERTGRGACKLCTYLLSFLSFLHFDNCSPKGDAGTYSESSGTSTCAACTSSLHPHFICLPGRTHSQTRQPPLLQSQGATGCTSCGKVMKPSLLVPLLARKRLQALRRQLEWLFYDDLHGLCDLSLSLSMMKYRATNPRWHRI